MIEAWRLAWPKALAIWSDFVMLRDPRFCETSVEAAKENLHGSFAMIRFADQQVVINLEAITQYKLEGYALEILAHEIGHHVFCPANLTDHALMLAKMRKALPTREEHAPFVANLYADLMLNDRLQRSAGLRMDAIYRALKPSPQPGSIKDSVPASQPDLWQFYLRIYEILWSLERKTLTVAVVSSEIEGDALLGSRLIRAYAHNPLLGASGFATLVFPYLAKQENMVSAFFSPLFDMEAAAEGSELPSGLSDGDDVVELDPTQDPLLNPLIRGKAKSDGRNPKKQNLAPRNIVEYGEIMKMLGTKLSEKQIVAAYYREISTRYLIAFPEKVSACSKELQAEGLEIWDIGESMENVDWFQSAAFSRTIIPGVTIVERHYSEVPGAEPEKLPIDLYIGIDCSGSMGNPAHMLSYPVLAGAIMARSALRARARVMACLSGESQGSTIATTGFIRKENEILELITDYLGTGYAFGIHHLRHHIVKRKRDGPVHILIVSDQDIFTILAETHAEFGKGWRVAEEAIKAAGGGGTMVLQINAENYLLEIALLERMGWSVFTVNSIEEIISFARNFSHKLYAKMKVMK